MNALPSPTDLLSLAAQEPADFEIEDYWKSVVTLRLRGWSWRRIAEWLSEHGLTLDHSSVHRFAKGNTAVRLASLPEKEFKSEAHDLLMENTSVIEGAEEFGSAVAETNACGFTVEEFDIHDRDYSDDKALKFDASFKCTGECLEDRPFSGDRISGMVSVSIHVDGTMDLEVTATRDDDPEWYDTDE